MDCESPFDLLGLYRGVNLAQKSTYDTPDDLDMIYLYRRPILDYWCDSGEDLAEVVKHVLIHEIGHHFGFSDDDMERSEEHTSELQSLMRISYAVFCLNNKNQYTNKNYIIT